MQVPLSSNFSLFCLVPSFVKAVTLALPVILAHGMPVRVHYPPPTTPLHATPSNSIYFYHPTHASLGHMTLSPSVGEPCTQLYTLCSCLRWITNARGGPKTGILGVRFVQQQLRSEDAAFSAEGVLSIF